MRDTPDRVGSLYLMMHFLNRRSSVSIAVIIAAGVAACSGPHASELLDAAPPVASAAPDLEGVARSTRDREREACASMRAGFESLPALPGAPDLESQRHQVLGRAKGWPVVFLREPAADRADLSPYLAALAESLRDPKRVQGAVGTLKAMASYRRNEVRSIVLPEGYFYASSPSVAQQMVVTFLLQTLFNERELWILRGSDVLHLVKVPLGYQYEDGPEAGQAASILLFDRVATSRDELFPSLHLDFVQAAQEAGFDRLRIERLTSEGVTASVRAGPDGPWVPAAFTRGDARATLACEMVTEADAKAVEAFRREARVRLHAVGKLREAALQEAAEQLPFDEPKEEVGQQDGSLRPVWNWTYAHGGESYSFNKIGYPVFDAKGRPHPPQVCVDFILDTYERASGTWYHGQKEARERTAGALDFDKLEIPNRRSLDAVVTFFREHPGMFDVWDLADEERVRLAEGNAFFGKLAEQADRLGAGNVVVIHGPRGGEAHYHSFLVILNDPVTGMPVMLAENAGKPRFRSWYSAMQNAPLRSIRHVMRPTAEWLGRVFGTGG